MTDEDESGGGVPYLAERLNVLFTRVPRRGGTQPYSNERAAEELAAAGITVTGTYLSQLRSGKRNNPSARLLAAIADLFDVPITYFFDSDQAAKVEEQLDLLIAMRNTRVRNILARTAGVSDDGLANWGALLEQIRRIERLDDDPEADGGR